MDVLPLALAGGWASGISAYATVLVIGLAGRAGLADVPAGLERTDVLVVVGLLAAVEFFADKIPWLDSGWDAVHTFVRPLIAAGLGALLAGDAETLGQAAAAALTAGVALLSHSAKTGLRLAVNTSPEPASNVAVSSTEELSVVGVLLLATQAPWLAAAIAMLLLLIALGLAWWLLSRIRRGWRRMWEWLGVTTPPPHDGERPVPEPPDPSRPA